ncbi:hypothetical protein E4U58_004632, partial [Claviceps cyperi]
IPHLRATLVPNSSPSTTPSTTPPTTQPWSTPSQTETPPSARTTTNRPSFCGSTTRAIKSIGSKSFSILPSWPSSNPSSRSGLRRIRARRPGGLFLLMP